MTVIPVGVGQRRESLTLHLLYCRRLDLSLKGGRVRPAVPAAVTVSPLGV